MRKYLVTIAIAALITGCSKSDKVDVSVSGGGVTTDRPAAVSDHNADAGSKIERQYSKFAEVKMRPDTSFLSDSERAVVNKLIAASDYLSQIYLLQLGVDNPALRTEIKENGTPIELAMFDLHFGPCDCLLYTSPSPRDS